MCKYSSVCIKKYKIDHYCSIRDADKDSYGPEYSLKEDILICQDEAVFDGFIKPVEKSS